MKWAWWALWCWHDMRLFWPKHGLILLLWVMLLTLIGSIERPQQALLVYPVQSAQEQALTQWLPDHRIQACAQSTLCQEALAAAQHKHAFAVHCQGGVCQAVQKTLQHHAASWHVQHKIEAKPMFSVQTLMAMLCLVTTLVTLMLGHAMQSYAFLHRSLAVPSMQSVVLILLNIGLTGGLAFVVQQSLLTWGIALRLYDCQVAGILFLSLMLLRLLKVQGKRAWQRALSLKKRRELSIIKR